MVKRYNALAHDCDPEIVSTEFGKFVYYKDFAALEAERDRLAARNAEYELLLKDTYTLCNPDWPWMHGLKKRIRAALAADGEVK